MATYLEIKAQIADLERQAAEKRDEETASAVAQIQSLMGEYSISIDDLRSARKKSGKKAGSKSDSTVKFHDPVSGGTWSGRGRKPGWLSGKDAESFRV